MTDKFWSFLLSAVADESSTSESLLAESRGDYSVVLNNVYVFDKFKNDYVLVPNRFVTGREIDNRLDNWEVVKERYHIEQNDKILNRAFRMVAKAGKDAKVLGCGVLDEGRKFFAVVHTSSISVRCSNGKDDVIDNYIVIISSHDGSLPICYYNLDVRRLTGAVYRIPESDSADFSIRKRHTPSEVDLNNEVSEALDMRSRWTKHLTNSIKYLCKPMNTAQLNRFLEEMWPTETATTEKRREHAESIHSKITELFNSSHNTGCYGHCAWSALNASSEYIDFCRDISDVEAAQHAFELDNHSHRLKVKLAKFLLT